MSVATRNHHAWEPNNNTICPHIISPNVMRHGLLSFISFPQFKHEKYIFFPLGKIPLIVIRSDFVTYISEPHLAHLRITNLKESWDIKFSCLNRCCCYTLANGRAGNRGLVALHIPSLKGEETKGGLATPQGLCIIWPPGIVTRWLIETSYPVSKNPNQFILFT